MADPVRLSREDAGTIRFYLEEHLRHLETEMSEINKSAESGAFNDDPEARNLAAFCIHNIRARVTDLKKQIENLDYMLEIER